MPEGGAILRVVPDQVNAKAHQANRSGPGGGLPGPKEHWEIARGRRFGGLGKEISVPRVRFAPVDAFFSSVGQRREPMAGNRSLGRWGVGLEVWQVSRAHAGNVLTW